MICVTRRLQLVAGLRQERRAAACIQAAVRGYRVRAHLRATAFMALRAVLDGKLSTVIRLRTVIARGFVGCLAFDRSGRGSTDVGELLKQLGVFASQQLQPLL